MATKLSARTDRKRKRRARRAGNNESAISDVFPVPVAEGAGIFCTEAVANGLVVIYGEYRWKPGHVSTRQVEYGTDVVFRFRLSGSSTLTYDNIDRVFEFVEGSSSALATRIPLIGVAREEQPATVHVHVTLRVSRAYLADVASEIDDPLLQFLAKGGPRKPMIFFDTRAASPQTSLVVRQVVQCPYGGAVKRLFLEGKARELIALYFASAPRPKIESAARVRFSQADMERIKSARDILSANLISPMTTEELAELVGMKVTKLKLGFRQLYGTSAFQFLRDHRLEQARAMLARGELTIERVAEECGFQNASHFTQAFRKHFGVTPRVVRGQRL